MKTKLPQRPARLARRHPRVWAAFETLADRCHRAGPLDARTRRLGELRLPPGRGRPARAPPPRRPARADHARFSRHHGRLELGRRPAAPPRALAPPQEVAPKGPRVWK